MFDTFNKKMLVLFRKENTNVENVTRKYPDIIGVLVLFHIVILFPKVKKKEKKNVLLHKTISN